MLLAALLMLGAQLCVAQNENSSLQRVSDELSLKSLYHPLEKIKFSSEAPVTHWIGNQSSKLLVKREGTWNEVDLMTGNETKFATVNLIADNLT